MSEQLENATEESAPQNTSTSDITWHGYGQHYNNISSDIAMLLASEFDEHDEHMSGWHK